MKNVLANLSVSVTELKKNPTALLNTAKGEPIVILNHNKPTAYLVPAELYEKMFNLIEDFELRNLIKERLAEQNEAVLVNLDEL